MPVLKVRVSVEQHLKLSELAEKMGWLWIENPTDGSVVSKDWLDRTLAEVIELGMFELELRADRVQSGVAH
jgi:hypothetical protein